MYACYVWGGASGGRRIHDTPELYATVTELYAAVTILAVWCARKLDGWKRE